VVRIMAAALQRAGHRRGKHRLGIAPCDRLRDIFGQIGKLAAVPGDDLVVALPALVDPGIGADHEPIGESQQEAPQGGREAPGAGHVVTIGQLAAQCRVSLQGTLEALRRHGKPAMRPDYSCGRVVAEDQLERALVAVGVEIEFRGGREIDHPLDNSPAASSPKT